MEVVCLHGAGAVRMPQGRGAGGTLPSMQQVKHDLRASQSPCKWVNPGAVSADSARPFGLESHPEGLLPIRID